MVRTQLVADVLPIERMSSTTRLLVLGVVRLFQPVHGYDVRRELMSWRADEWASIGPGSIYNALKTLSREGLLEVVGTRQVGGRPERTSYRMTPTGEEELRTLLYEAWWTVKTPLDALMPAISFLSLVPRGEAVAALEHRIGIARQVTTQLGYLADHVDQRDSPKHVREMLLLLRARVGAELPWAEQFLGRLRAGDYLAADDPGHGAPTPPVRKPRQSRRKPRTRSRKA